jgi:hypothetical protein
MVAIILDPAFGDRVEQVLAGQPVWICHSALNRLATEAIWAAKPLPSDELTIFNTSPSDTPESNFISILGTIDEHHPNWTTLEVIGVQLTEEVKLALTDVVDGRFSTIANGFLFKRFSD